MYLKYKYKILFQKIKEFCLAFNFGWVSQLGVKYEIQNTSRKKNLNKKYK